MWHSQNSFVASWDIQVPEVPRPPSSRQQRLFALILGLPHCRFFTFPHSIESRATVAIKLVFRSVRINRIPYEFTSRLYAPSSVRTGEGGAGHGQIRNPCSEQTQTNERHRCGLIPSMPLERSRPQLWYFVACVQRLACACCAIATERYRSGDEIGGYKK